MNKEFFIFPCFSEKDVPFYSKIQDRCLESKNGLLKKENGKCFFCSKYSEQVEVEFKMKLIDIDSYHDRLINRVSFLISNVARREALKAKSHEGTYITKELSGFRIESTTVNSIVSGTINMMIYCSKKRTVIYFISRIFFKLCTNHIWLEGNKRTSMFTLHILLKELGLLLVNFNGPSQNPETFTAYWYAFVCNVADWNCKVITQENRHWKRIFDKREDVIKYIETSVENNLLIMYSSRTKE